MAYSKCLIKVGYHYHCPHFTQGGDPMVGLLGSLKYHGNTPGRLIPKNSLLGVIVNITSSRRVATSVCLLRPPAGTWPAWGSVLWAVDGYHHSLSPRRRRAAGAGLCSGVVSVGITALLPTPDSAHLQNPVACASFPETSLCSLGSDVSLWPLGLKNAILERILKVRTSGSNPPIF